MVMRAKGGVEEAEPELVSDLHQRSCAGRSPIGPSGELTHQPALAWEGSWLETFACPSLPVTCRKRMNWRPEEEERKGKKKKT